MNGLGQVCGFADARFVTPLLIAAALCGCQTVPETRVVGPVRGLLWVFPGVGAGTISVWPACQGLRDGGVDAEIRVMQWDRPWPDILGQLTDHEANQAQAADVARQIAAYRERHPAAAVDLVGYSGGGGLALMVAEALPEGVHVRNVVLAQPAVGPTHDLTRALRHVDGQLVNFYSPHDWLILGAGTETFGTVDRQYVASAGKEGFNLAVAAPDETLRAKVVQVSWTPEMIWSGHLGNHVSIMGYTWNRDYVAPHLRPARQPAATRPSASSTSGS